ncbi:glucosaminidase domain-containing protein [Escherichia coli]|uniref:glucosaminidase domain-containing protein n=1 Tax=Escherichia coli TaxID=562 RepID=UPI000CFC8200|nr:glucosaminidase domain-containing protein [Escherichia coli]
MGSYDKACNNTGAVRFVQQYLKECELIAKQLDVPVENILGLAAKESFYGQGRIATEYNNYFSMHGPAPLQSGQVHPLGSKQVWVATYTSFSTSGKSFAIRFGNAVRNKKSPEQFAQALIDSGFNSGKNSNGGHTGYASELVGVINMVKRRITCPVN